MPVIDRPRTGLDAAFHRFHHGQALAAVPWDGWTATCGPVRAGGPPAVVAAAPQP
ncbi:hypothetical protein [Nocardiopsis deserti]|uniref:hypothetical protein n=1 Tax=Nocardiopsis deserti TaxID=2605988 RepID=UPI00167FECF8|nr:hypothetical protein [Nocardiopsis deserti]